MSNKDSGGRHEDLLKAYLRRQGEENKIPAESTPPPIEKKEASEPVKSTEPGKKRGRKARVNRPGRSAAKRTNEGEERYIVTLKVEDIEFMKAIAKQSGVTIKEVFTEAIAEYRKIINANIG